MKYKYRPKTKDELKEIIEKEIEIQGNNADLNMIDTSLITDMSELFVYSDFNGDISKWNVSNVINMNCMFNYSKFNGDISNWDVSNVKDMSYMFSYSKFNGDISNWDISNVRTMFCMFYKSKFNGDISQWDVSNVKIMSYMFKDSKFNGDISNWDVSSVNNVGEMLYNSKIPDKVKATVMLKLSKNDDCELDKIIDGYNEGDNIIEFILDNFNHKDVCYVFEKADIPYEKVMHLVKKMLEIDCLYRVYPVLYGEMINDMLDI